MLHGNEYNRHSATSRDRKESLYSPGGVLDATHVHAEFSEQATFMTEIILDIDDQQRGLLRRKNPRQVRITLVSA